MRQRKKIILTAIPVCLLLISTRLFISPVYINPFQNKSPGGKVMITAHRGGAGLGHENAVATISKILHAKPAQIEADVQLTADSVIVLFHDKTLERLYNSKKAINDITWQELFAISKGRTRDPVATFSEVLYLLNGQCEFLIEVKKYKHYNQAIEKLLCDKIDSIQGYRWCIIQSFDEGVLKRIHQRNPHIRLAKLILGKVPFSQSYFDYDAKPESLDSLYFCESFHANHIFTTQALVDWIHSRNKKIKVWTVNSASAMYGFANMGVDGIITDYVNLFEYQ